MKISIARNEATFSPSFIHIPPVFPAVCLPLKPPPSRGSGAKPCNSSFPSLPLAATSPDIAASHSDSEHSWSCPSRKLGIKNHQVDLSR